VYDLNLTEKLADFAVKTGYEDIPDPVLRRTKTHVLDTLGVTIAGYRSIKSSNLFAAICLLGGSGEATIIGDGRRISVQNAAMINTIAAQVLELNDTHTASGVHPGQHTVPAALAMGEKMHSTGKEMLASIVVGYDVMIRISSALPPLKHQWWATNATVGTFGAAISSGKMLDLDKERMICALGIAGSRCFGSRSIAQDMKDFNPGLSEWIGVTAAMMARMGVKGPDNALERSHGFYDVSSDEFNRQRVTAGLGDIFKIMETDFKPYACCRHIHPSIDACLEVLRKNKIDPDSVKRIVVRTYEKAVEIAGSPLFKKQRPESAADARFSIPYCVALATVLGKVGPEEVAEHIDDTKVLRLAQKIEVLSDARLVRLYPTKHPAVIEVLTSGGEIYSEKVGCPKGSSENPMREIEIQERFRESASKLWNPKKVEQVFMAVHGLETLDNLSEFAQIMK